MTLAIVNVLPTRSPEQRLIRSSALRSRRQLGNRPGAGSPVGALAGGKLECSRTHTRQGIVDAAPHQVDRRTRKSRCPRLKFCTHAFASSTRRVRSRLHPPSASRSAIESRSRSATRPRFIFLDYRQGQPLELTLNDGRTEPYDSGPATGQHCISRSPTFNQEWRVWARLGYRRRASALTSAPRRFADLLYRGPRRIRIELIEVS